MKKALTYLIYFLLPALLLCACGRQAPDPYTAADLEALLAGDGLFNSELAPVDGDVAVLLYGLDGSTVTEAVCRLAANTSVSADELTLLILTDEDAALAAEEACRGRVASQIAVCESYCPAAVPRLEGAVIRRLGNTVLLAVGDPDLLPGAVDDLRAAG